MDVTTQGLWAKFFQNDHLAHYLMDTGDRKIGEASKSPCWGIGFTLEDQQALDVAKWNNTGNLLGNLLMKIRSELMEANK